MRTFAFLLIFTLNLISLGQLSAKNNTQSTWFIAVAGGAQVYMGEGDDNVGLSKRITPAVDVSFGRWFNHIWGARLQYNGMQAKGATGANNQYADEQVSSSIYKQSFDYLNVHADVMFNLSAAICNYPRRFYEIIPYVGIGYANAYKSCCPSKSSLSVNLGILNKFRISRSFDINIDLRSMFVSEKFDNEEGGFPLEGVAAATLGLTYRF